MTNVTDSEVLATARNFWEQKILKHIQMFEYGKYTEDEFVINMERMGYDEELTRSFIAQD